MNKIDLHPKHREMLAWCLKNSSHFRAIGFGDAEYVLLNRVLNYDMYYDVDKDRLNTIRERYIEWVIQLPF